MIKVILCLMLWGVGLWGQGTSTIYQTLVTNRNAAYISGPVKNIGQGYHKTTVLLRDNVPAVCASSVATISLNGSHDNSIWYEIPQSNIGTTTTTGSATYKFAKSIEGYGAYPYVRVAVSGTDGVNCNFDVLYSANVNSPDRVINKVDEVGIGTPNRINFRWALVNAIGSTHLVNAVAGKKIIVYGIDIYNETAAQDITVQDSSGSIFFYYDNVPQAFTKLFPLTNSAWFIGNTGEAIDMLLTANTPVTVMIWYIVQ